MGSKTYPRVQELLEKEVPSKISRNAFCRATGINPNSFDRYKAGISEPTTATLQKLADYFGVTVAWLRGEEMKKIISFYDSDRAANLILEGFQDLPEITDDSVKTVTDKYVLPLLSRLHEPDIWLEKDEVKGKEKMYKAVIDMAVAMVMDIKKKRTDDESAPPSPPPNKPREGE